MRQNNFVGDRFLTNNFGYVTIIHYVSSKEVRVKFERTGYELDTQMSNVRASSLKDPLQPSVRRIGIIGTKYPTHVNKEQTREYNIWCSMLAQVKRGNAGISDNFKSYEYFVEWCQRQKGYEFKGWNLNKNLVPNPGNIYSEDTCCFLPREICSIHTKFNMDNLQQLNLGITRVFRKYHVNWQKPPLEPLKGFATKEQAFLAYKQNKEAYVRQLGKQYKDLIDPRVYKYLINYKLSVNG